MRLPKPEIMMRLSLPLNLAMLAIFSVPALAQTPPLKFDVASIRERDPNGPIRIVDPNISPVHPGEYTDPGTPLVFLIAFAYGIKTPDLNLTGLPKWAQSTSYSISAKAGPDYPPMSEAENDKQVRLMMRQLLAERFKLQIHSETRIADVLALEAGKPGKELRQVPAPIPPEKEGFVGMAAGDRSGRMIGNKSTMAGLAQALSMFFRQPVVDRTGWTGYFDFDVRWASTAANPAPGLGPDGLAMIYTALQDNFGISMKSVKAPVEFWVIDHVEPPTPN